MKRNHSARFNEIAQPSEGMGLQNRGPSTWLSAIEAADHLRLSLADFANLVTDRHVIAYRTLLSDPFFKRQELDAVMVPIPADEAGAFVTQSLQTQEMNLHMTPNLSDGHADALMPLNDAAKALGIPYKRMLRFANDGTILATNIGTKRKPCWRVDLTKVRQSLSDMAERQSARRRTPQPVDLLRFARTGGRHA